MVKFFDSMTNQMWLKKKLREAGFKLKPGGTCLGISCMAMHTALLDGGIKHFNDMLLYIFDKKPHPDAATDKEKVNEEIKQFLYGIYRYQKLSKTTELHSKNTFFSGKAPRDSTTTFAPTNHKLTLEQRIEKRSHYYPSRKKTQTDQQTLCYMDTLTVKQSIDTLFAFFLSYRKIAKKNKASNNIMFLITGKKHAITISHNKKRHVWMIIDSNKLPVTYIKSTRKLARKIYRAFFRYKFGRHATLKVRIFTSQAHLDKAMPIVSAWQKPAAMQNTEAPVKPAQPLPTITKSPSP